MVVSQQAAQFVLERLAVALCKKNLGTLTDMISL